MAPSASSSKLLSKQTPTSFYGKVYDFKVLTNSICIGIGKFGCPASWGISKFHQSRGMFSPVAMIQKLYPGRYQDRTTGMNCHAIADLIRKHGMSM